MPFDLVESTDTLAWILVIVGFALVIASWAGRIGQRAGWAGAWMTIAGAGTSWVDSLAMQGAILAAGAVAIALLWLPRGRKRGWTPRLARRAYRPWDQEAELLGLCHGDKAMVERLIRYEIERNPKLSRAGAALSAATRLRHEKA